MAITTAIDKVRLLIGDTDENAILFEDDEITWFLSERGNDVYLAAADACESAARKFARAFDFETDGQRFQRSQMSKMFRDLAKDLRGRTAGVVTVEATRVDGYSQDTGNQDVGEAGTNPRLVFRRSQSPDDLP